MLTAIWIGLCCLLTASGPTTGSASAPATGNEVVLLLDRFGVIHTEHQALDLDEAVRFLGHDPSCRRVTVLREPFALEADLRQFHESLASQFPDIRVVDREARPGDPVSTAFFPAHSPLVQAEVLLRGNGSWDELAGRHRQLWREVQSYLDGISRQAALARSDMAALQQQYRHLAAPTAGKETNPR